MCIRDRLRLELDADVGRLLAMFSRAQLPYTVAAAVLMALQPILVTLSKNPLGAFDYSVPASTLLSEMLKLGVSSALLARELACGGGGGGGRLLHETSLPQLFSFMLPALIYFVNNNCVFYILQAVGPTTFQLLSQMKTIFTGLLFRACLKRQLAPAQYLALITLACGTAGKSLPILRFFPFMSRPISSHMSHPISSLYETRLFGISFLCSLADTERLVSSDRRGGGAHLGRDARGALLFTLCSRWHLFRGELFLGG